MTESTSNFLVAGEDPPEDPARNTRPAQYASRIDESCSLYSCNNFSGEYWYCWSDHERLAHDAQNMVYIIVGKDLCNVIALLKKVNYEIAQGIRMVEEGEIFRRVPWEWEFIDLDFLEGETDRSWLFFHSISNPPCKSFDYNGAILHGQATTITLMSM